MTTATELRDTRTRLTERLAEVSQVCDRERIARERAKEKVTKVAHERGTMHSIGPALDDLLIELGLTPRPQRMNVVYDVTIDQTAGVREVRIGSGMPWAENYLSGDQPVHVVTTSRISVQIEVPRDHEGCACTVPAPEDPVTEAGYALPEGVTVVSVAPHRCNLFRQRDDDGHVRCSTARAREVAAEEARVEAERARLAEAARVAEERLASQSEIDDAPAPEVVVAVEQVDLCTEDGHPGGLHWHWTPSPESSGRQGHVYNSPVGWASATPERWERVGGTFTTDPEQVTPAPVPEVDEFIVQECGQHHANEAHWHFTMPGDAFPSYDLIGVTPDGDWTRQPGVFARGDDVGKAVVRECTETFCPEDVHHHFDNGPGSITYTTRLSYRSSRDVPMMPGVWGKGTNVNTVVEDDRD